MSISTTPVQQATGSTGAGSSYGITLGGSPVNGSCLVLFHTSAAATGTITSISQAGATWARVAGDNALRNGEIWAALNVSGASTAITVNMTLGANASGNCSEWSGVATGSATDVASATNGTSVTPATPSGTPLPGLNELIIGCIRAGGNVTAGPTGGFTALTSPDASRCFGAYQVVSSTTGSYQATWTAGLGNWEGVIGSFKAAQSTLVRRTLGNLGTRAGSRGIQ